MKKETLQQGDRRLMMLTTPIPKLVIKMAIPTIIAFLISSIYSLADTLFIAMLDDTNATAAVSVNATLDQLIMMCGSMLAIGANSYIARLLGEGNEKKASQTLSFAFFVALGIGLLLMIFGTVFMTDMVKLMGAKDAAVQGFAIDYATYVLLAAPFMASSFVMNQCLRSEGSAMLSMVGMSVGGVLNCILDPIFIFGLNMGVAGASVATAISKVVSFAVLIFPYITKRSMLRLSVKNISFSWDIIKNVVSVGSSSMLRNGLAVLSAIMLNNIAGDISTSVQAAVGVCTKIMMFPFSIVLGFGTGFQPVAGFSWGAKRYDRVKESYRYAAKMAVMGAAVMAAILIGLSYPLMTAFARSDAQAQKIGTICIVLQSITLPVHAWVAIVNMLCNGLGNAKGAVALATSRQGSCFIPFVHLAGYFFRDLGVASIQAVADALSLALAIPISRSMNKKIDAALQAQLQEEGEQN